ncbi:LexA DNA binding domain-containing protein [Sphingobium faniae]|nr:LexA DNA binding domain-containing protein [Sphingobium faniae]
MTERQLLVLNFIRERIESTGVCPSLVEIAGAMGVKSKSNAHRVIGALIRDGHLCRGASRSSRNLRLANDNLRKVSTSALMAELERRGVRLG